jgi:hypothetical protein
MQVGLKNPSKISLESHPNYRVVKVSNRQDPVGMLLPYANLVVPDKQAVRDLKEIIQFYEQLKPSKPFNDGLARAANQSHGATGASNAAPRSHQPAVSDLPLFEKL